MDTVATPTGVTGAAEVKTAVPGNATESNAKEVQTQEKPAPILTRKIKINGEEVEMDAEKAFMLASKGLGAEKKFEEAARLRKEADELISPLKEKKILDALVKQGMTRDEAKAALEDELIKLIEEESLTPEQRKQRERDAELERYKTEEQKRKEDAEKTKRQQEVEREFARIEDEIIGAFEKSSLPRHPFLAKRVAAVMLGADQQGVELPATDAVKYVEAEYKREIQTVLSSMDVPGLREFLGKELTAKLREADVAAVKQAEAPFTKPKEAVSQAPKVSEKPGEKKVNSRFFDEIRGIRR